jgi:Gpi18-like mannosyltransferase
MRPIDKFFETEFKIFGVTITLFDVFFFTIIACLGMYFRLALYDIASGDYTLAFADWMRECHEAGGFAYLGIKPGVSDASTFDYNCMFQYIIVILHYIGGGISDMYLVKTVSVIFDYVCAITIMRITYNVTAGSVKKSLMAFAAVMFLPTVVLNSAAWAQNDSIFTSFILLSFLSILKGKDNRAFIYLALSYSFKQQAIFFMPFIIIMWLKNRVKIRYILWVPVIHVAAMIPCAIAGRSWGDLLGIYGKQVTMFSRLSMNYPSIYTIITSDLNKSVRKLIITGGTMATVIIMGMIAYYVYKKKFEITSMYMLTLVIFTSEICCFCLPAMHERYGYLPEILTVIYALTNYKRLPICAALQVIAMITYTRFLFGSTVLTLWPLTCAMLVIILLIGYDFYTQMNNSEKGVKAKNA